MPSFGCTYGTSRITFTLAGLGGACGSFGLVESSAAIWGATVHEPAAGQPGSGVRDVVPGTGFQSPLGSLKSGPSP